MEVVFFIAYSESESPCLSLSRRLITVSPFASHFQGAWCNGTNSWRNVTKNDAFTSASIAYMPSRWRRRFWTSDIIHRSSSIMSLHGWVIYTDYLYYYCVIINSGGVVHIFLIIIACHCRFVLGTDCNTSHSVSFFHVSPLIYNVIFISNLSQF